MALMLRVNLAGAHHALWHLVEARATARELVERFEARPPEGRLERVAQAFALMYRGQSARRAIAALGVLLVWLGSTPAVGYSLMVPLEAGLSPLTRSVFEAVRSGPNPPGAVVVLGTGALAANLIGQKVVRWAELALARIPVIKGIYSSVKQVSDTLLAPGGQAFRKPVLVRFPHGDSWTIAFLTGQPGPGVAEHLDGEHLSVYVPTTPNPTSGYFIIVPRRDAVELDMSVDEALKYVISMGVVSPTPHASPAGGDRKPSNPS
jgi:hypothetical protein